VVVLHAKPLASAGEIQPWRYSASAIAVRLFLTCWLIYSLHFATNTVREIYLALAIGERFSFRVDEYAGMHPDLFEKPGYGWHINGNPGASMVAALPWAVVRPWVDAIVKRVNAGRAATAGPPVYDSPWPMAREFYAEAWKRGYDIKFGLAALITQAFAMAPISAFASVLMFLLLRRLLASDRAALLLALVYAFATPVFFRTGYLNHNLMLGHIAFAGFIAMWNPGHSSWLTEKTRFLLGGLGAGSAVLFDYSGAVVLVTLFVYAVLKGRRHAVLPFLTGAAFPIVLLLLYQWRSFGHPLYPPQHWMPAVRLSHQGYQGFGFPQIDLLLALLFDYRYGLFVAGPFFALALAWPFLKRRSPALEINTMLALAAVLWLFFSCVNYAWIQYNTGIRYMAAAFPFLFVPAALVLARLPLRAAYLIAFVCAIESWCLAMHRDVERGMGVLDPILTVFVGGFRLPVLTVISGMRSQYGDYASAGVSPLPVFLLAAGILYGVWSNRLARSRI
jgi:hypothetical protein